VTDRIFLIGFMGCGKSTLGRLLADAIGYQFVDTDQLIEEKCGSSVAQIFAEKGEDSFRQMERETLENLVKQQRIVVATGGGMACSQQNIETMNAAGTTIYLQALAENLADWLKAERQKRPLIAQLSDEQLRQYVAETLTEREKFYCQATITIQVDQNYTTDNEMISRIVRLL
jgi:shikimate kinase